MGIVKLDADCKPDDSAVATQTAALIAFDMVGITKLMVVISLTF